MIRRSLSLLVIAVVLASATCSASASISLDRSYAGGRGYSIWHIPRKRAVGPFDSAILPNGGVALAGAYAEGVSYSEYPALMVVDGRGKVDGRFDLRRGHFKIPGRLAHFEVTDSWAYAVAAQRDGKILLATDANVATGRDRRGCSCDAYRGGIAIWRIGRDGRLDPTFGDGGIAAIGGYDASSPALSDHGASPELSSLVLDRRGRVYVYATSYRIRKRAGQARAVLVRLTSNGRLDRGFGHHGRIVEFLGAIYPDMREPLTVGVRHDGEVVTIRSGRRRVRGYRGYSNVAWVSWYSADGSSVHPRRRRGHTRMLRLGKYSYNRTLRARVERSGAILFDTDVWLKNTSDPLDGRHRAVLIRLQRDGLADPTFGKGGRVVIPMDPDIRYASLRAIDKVPGGYRAVLSGEKFGIDKSTNHLLNLDERGKVRRTGNSIGEDVPPIPGVGFIEALTPFFTGSKLLFAGSCDEWEDTCISTARFKLGRVGG